MPPPTETLAVVKKAVAARNLVAHTGWEATIELVDETLQAVKDILRLLDYYRGHDWARHLMSYPFAVALGLREQDAQLDQFYSQD